MDQNRNQTQQQGNRMKNQPQGNKQQSKTQQWDGNERRTGAERRNSDTGMQMNEGSSR